MALALKLVLAGLIVFSSVKCAWALSPEEEGVKRWFDAVTSGNNQELYNAACSDATAKMGLIDTLTDGGVSAFGFLAALLRFDYSRLEYSLIWQDENKAYVRVNGTVGEPKSLINPEKDWVPFEKVNGRRGLSNIAIVVYERGAWRHCDYLSSQQARNVLQAAPPVVAPQVDRGVFPGNQARSKVCTVADPTGSPLNIRATPNGSIIDKLHNGVRVNVEGITMDELGRPWANLESGWVFYEFLSCP